MNTFKGSNVELEQIKELIARIETSKLSKFILKKGDFELHLEKEGVNYAPPPPLRHNVVASVSNEDAFQSELPLKGERGGSKHIEVPSGTFVTSPMVGTFYAAPAPDQPPFVKVGDSVQENTVVCIIEAMKVMNEVKAGVSGKVVEVVADASQPVEFGSRLFRIQP